MKVLMLYWLAVFTAGVKGYLEYDNEFYIEILGLRFPGPWFWYTLYGVSVFDAVCVLIISSLHVNFQLRMRQVRKSTARGQRSLISSYDFGLVSVAS